MFGNGFPDDWSALKRLIWLKLMIGSGSSSILKTITGALIHITDALAKPAHELVAVLKPVQSGTGDPSPTNVRPISGWTGANIGGSGNNILDSYLMNWVPGNCVIAESGGVSAYTGKGSANYTFIDVSEYIGKSLYLNHGPEGGSGAGGIAFYSAATANSYVSGIRAGSTSRKNGWVFTVPNNPEIKYMRFTGYPGYENQTVICEADKVNVLPINWQTEAGTIYGGTLTLNEDGSGTLISNMWTYTINGGVVKASQESYNTDSSTYVRKNNLGIRYKRSGDYTIDNNICDSLVYVTSGWDSYTRVNGWGSAYNSYTDIGLRLDNSLAGILSTDTYDERVTKINAYLAEHPITVGGELETPVTYNLTALQVLTLLQGENNIWVDASDDLTLTYYADGNVSDAEALNTLLGGMYSPGGDVSDREALDILLGN